MRIVDVFDAVREGDFQEFQRLYVGDINVLNEFSSHFNLLQSVLISTNKEAERLKIIDFLLKNNIDINYKDRKFYRNALHWAFFNFLEGDAEYLLKVVTMLVDAGIEINALDKFKAIPLKYAITIGKLNTEEIEDVYRCMIRAGSDYNLKDAFGKSCIDYAKELTWRNGFIKIVEEMGND
ncbi:MAG: hypothetical protein NC416_13045 [Eubacterium sp.]|nr:hypothetical protein [Eubacterium sp.]